MKKQETNYHPKEKDKDMSEENKYKVIKETLNNLTDEDVFLSMHINPFRK